MGASLNDYPKGFRATRDDGDVWEIRFESVLFKGQPEYRYCGVKHWKDDYSGKPMQIPFACYYVANVGQAEKLIEREKARYAANCVIEDLT